MRSYVRGPDLDNLWVRYSVTPCGHSQQYPPLRLPLPPAAQRMVLYRLPRAPFCCRICRTCHRDARLRLPRCLMRYRFRLRCYACLVPLTRTYHFLCLNGVVERAVCYSSPPTPRPACPYAKRLPRLVTTLYLYLVATCPTFCVPPAACSIRHLPRRVFCFVPLPVYPAHCTAT